MDTNLLMQIIIIVLLLVLIIKQSTTESLCVKKEYGAVTDVPHSSFVDANMALVHSTSLGQAPLGDPRYWLPNRSPITQGQWGLYQDGSMTNYKALPVYTDGGLPPQCTKLN